MAYEKDIVTLDGENIEIKRGALRKSLQAPKDHKFKRGELLKLSKIPIGEEFEFLGKKLKMTPLRKDRITLGANLLKRTKK